MKVLVTGATGFIGQHLIPRLLDRGHAVIATAREPQKADALPWRKDVQFVAFDIGRRPDEVSRVFERPDATVHLAWPSLEDYASLVHLENALPAHCRFLKGLVEYGVEQLLVTGTCLEYGMKNGALAEDVPTDPVSPYALAKDTLRKYLEHLRRRSAFTLQWARLFYTYGPGQRANSLLAELDRAIDKRQTSFGMSGGEQLRDYLPVEDVAQRIAALVECRKCDGCVNICSGVPVSVRTLVERHLARRSAQVHLNLGQRPYPSYEPMAFWGDGTKYASYCASE